MDGACVVDEDVDAAESGDDLVEEMVCSVGGGEVGLEGVGGATGGLDGGGGVVGGAAVAVAGHGCSGLCECCGDGGSEAAGGTGDESDFVVETEEVKCILHVKPMYRMGVTAALTTVRFGDVSLALRCRLRR